MKDAQSSEQGMQEVISSHSHPNLLHFVVFLPVVRSQMWSTQWLLMLGFAYYFGGLAHLIGSPSPIPAFLFITVLWNATSYLVDTANQGGYASSDEFYRKPPGFLRRKSQSQLRNLCKMLPDAVAACRLRVLLVGAHVARKQRDAQHHVSRKT